MFLKISLLLLIGVTEFRAHNYGMLGSCPGSEQPATITDRYLNKHIFLVVQKHFLVGLYRKRYMFDKAAHGIGTDPHIDFKNRKTMVFMDGYMDSTDMIPPRIATGLYARQGWNTIAVESQRLFSFVYPIAARNARAVGNITAVILNKLMEYGLDPKDVELMGVSLGAQTLSFVGKRFYEISGKKIGSIVSVDTAGPCYRGLPSKYRLAPTDADFVQVIHTNTEGFGTGEPLGHVDFYVNGGEFQFLIENHQPWCEDFCSHAMGAFVYFIAFGAYPDKFVGVRCKDVQQAREHRCYDNIPHDTNLLGPRVNTSNHGIFYVPASGIAPFFAPDDFMEKRINYDLEYADAFNNIENLLFK